MSMRCGPTILILMILPVFGALVRCGAAVPQISNVFPDFPTDYPSAGPHLITGEDFEPGRTEVWVWDAGREDGSKTVPALPRQGDVSLPETLPTNARRIMPLDVELQVIVVPLEGVAVWVRTPAGTSRPYLFNVAKPCWLGPQRVEPGATIHVYGFGLRAPWQPCRIALAGDGRQYSISPKPPDRDYRAEDSTLIYFDVPNETLAGSYSVWIHNGNGGTLGWRQVGTIEVVAPVEVKERLLDVREFGARGDDEENDYAAIAKALATARDMAGESVRPVVYFPPGKFRTDTTLQVPFGVTLRGAGRDLSVIEGFGMLPPERKTTALIHAANHTALESLTFQGFTTKGPGHYWMALVNPPPPKMNDEPLEDFTIRGCRLYGDDVHSSTPRFVYRQALAVPRFRGIRILDNEFFGPVSLGDHWQGSYRAEFIGNTIHGGGNADNVSLNAPQLFESIIDGTQLRDAATRFLVNARRHCAIRFNEVHDYQRSIWANAEETFLVHGDVSKSGGRSSGGAASTLADQSKRWRPDYWRDAEVLIVSGRGFGQHRTVSDNTADTLTVRPPWRVTPDATSQYVVGQYFVENSWYANFNDTPGRMSLWLECVGNVVEKHRDAFAGGIDIWGEDSTEPNEPVRTPHNLGYMDHHFMPAWYNIIHGSWFDGSLVKLWSKAPVKSPFAGPAFFGNYIVANHIRAPHLVRTGFELTPQIDGGIWIGNRSGRDMTHRLAGRIALSHTIVAGNVVSHTPRGIAVADTARKTFVLKNEFEDVETPVLNWGQETIQRDNATRILDVQGERAAPILEQSGKEPSR